MIVSETGLTDNAGVPSLTPPAAAPPGVSVVLRPHDLSEPVVGVAEAHYVAGLEALAREDPSAALASLGSGVRLASSGALPSARLLLGILSGRFVDVQGAADAGELIVAAPDVIARSVVAASALRLTPLSWTGLALTSSGFLASPSLVDRLLALPTAFARDDWAAAGKLLLDLGRTLTRAGADRSPAVPFELIPSGGGGVTARNLEPFVLELLTLRGVLQGSGPRSNEALLSALDSVHGLVHLLTSTLSAAQLDLVLIDPKRTEMTRWDGDPHLAAEIADDPAKGIMHLKGLVNVMERRYRWLQMIGCKDIEAALAQGETCSYCVCVIDGLTDLVRAHKDCEELIVRLTQRGRAVGIHLVFTLRAPCLIALRSTVAFQPDVTLKGLTALTALTLNAAGEPDKTLALVAEIEAMHATSADELKGLGGARRLRRPLAVATSLAVAGSSMHAAKAFALTAKGRTDAALLVWDDAIGLGSRPDAPTRWRWVGWARYCKSRLLYRPATSREPAASSPGCTPSSRNTTTTMGCSRGSMLSPLRLVVSRSPRPYGTRSGDAMKGAASSAAAARISSSTTSSRSPGAARIRFATCSCSASRVTGAKAPESDGASHRGCRFQKMSCTASS